MTPGATAPDLAAPGQVGRFVVVPAAYVFQLRDDGAGLHWCRLEGPPDPVVPHERQVLDAIRSGLVEPYTTSGWKPMEGGADR